MQTGNLEFILAWASILGAVLAAFGFLHREMSEGSKRQDERFDRQDERFDKRLDLQDEKFDKRLDLQDEKFDKRFDLQDEKFDKRLDLQDEKFRQLGEQLTAVRVGVARIEGHLGFGFDVPADVPAGERRAGDAPPERAA